MAEDVKQVVTVRLAGYELYALEQLAALTGRQRSDALRQALVEAMRSFMLTHPEWPIHPAWAGDQDGPKRDDKWIVTLFQHFAWAVVAPDAAKHFDPVKLDGVSAFRLKGEPPKASEWEKNLRRYRREQEASK